MKFHSALKSNELSSHEKTWRHGGKLNCILLSERCQSEKVTYCVIPTTWHSGKGKTIETVKRSIVAMGSWVVRDEWVEDRGFLGQWKYSVRYYYNGYVIILLSKPIECTTPRVNPKVNYGHWVIRMYHPNQKMYYLGE